MLARTLLSADPHALQATAVDEAARSLGAGGSNLVREEEGRDCLAELRTEHAQLRLVEVRAGKRIARLGPEERGLAREGVGATELLVHYAAPRVQLALGDPAARAASSVKLESSP